MRNLRSILLCLLTTISVVANAANDYVVENHIQLLFNGVPALMDTTNYIIYATVDPSTDASFKPTVTVDYANSDSAAANMTLSLGTSGTLHVLPHVYNVQTWNSRSWNMRMCVNNKITTWKLVVTLLPIVNLDVSIGSLKNLYETDPDTKQDCRIRIIDPLSRLNDSIAYEHFAGIKIRGQHSSDFAKKSFSIELRNDTTKEDENANLFNIRHDADWILDAMFVDPSCMRNRLLTDIWNTIDDLPYEKDNDYQANGTTGQFVEVFARNEYLGLYCFTDKVDRKKLNLKKAKDNEDGTQEVRGLLVRGRHSCDATLLNGYDATASTDSLTWQEWEQEYPTDSNSMSRWDIMKEFIDVCGNYSRLKTEFNDWLYMDNAVDFFLFLNSFYLIENTNKNYFLSFRNVTKEHKALFTLWDMDASLGRNGSGEEKFEDTTRFGFNTKMINRIGLFSKLFNDEILHFKNRIRSRWDEIKGNQLSVANITKRINTYRKLLENSGAYQREKAKWPKATTDSILYEAQRMINWYTWNYAKMDSVITQWSPYAGQDDPVPVNPVDEDTVNICGYKVRPSRFLIDNVPLVVDEVNNKMYASISPAKISNSTLSISTDKEGVEFSQNGEDFSNPLQYNFTNCNDTTQHLFIRNTDMTVEYKLEFTSLPLVCIDTDWKKVIRNCKNELDEKTGGYMYIVDAQKQTGDAEVFEHRIATKVRGASSMLYDKKSLAVEIRNDSTGVETEDAEIFGIRKDDDWILDAMYIDKSRMRNRILFDIWNTIDDLPYEKDNEYQFNGTHGQHVEVIINGEYAGLYCLSDKIDRKKLNLKKIQIGNDSTEYVTRGVLYKGNSWSNCTMMHKFDDENFGDGKLTWQGWEQSYPDELPLYGTWRPLMNFLDLTCDEMGRVSYSRLAEEYQDYFYLNNLTDYYLFFNAVALYDNTMKNTFLSVRNLNKTQQMLFTPWDLDASLGRNPVAEDLSQDAQYYAFGKKLFNRCGFFNRLMLDNNFQFHSLLHGRWNQLKNNQLSVSNVMSYFNTCADKLTNSGAWRREHAMWPEYTDNNLSTEIKFINDFYTKNWTVFENYVKDYPDGIENIELDSNGNNNGAIIAVTDLSGRTVAKNSTAGLPTGVYIVTTNVNGKRHTEKVSVK